MKKILWLVAAVVALAFLLPGQAQAEDKDKKGKKGDKLTVFNFEEDEVTVSFLKPDVGFVGLIQQEKAASLIKIRDDFVDEIIRSAEDL
jgi:hypothetical protein